jgi:predicted AlkP superfamily pyrophosphatase or phosphodiesterase
MKRKALLIFFLDAVRSDYITRKGTPFLYELGRTGTFVPMRTILGFDGIAATIATGTYPDVHGVWTQYLRGTNGDEPFRWLNPMATSLDRIDRAIAAPILRKSLRVMTLACTMLSGGLRHYPGAHEVPYHVLPYFSYSLRKKVYAESAFRVPTMFDIARRARLSLMTIDRQYGSDNGIVAKALRKRKTADLIYVRLMDLDKVTHKYGVDSPERRMSLLSTDNAVRDITEHFAKMGTELQIAVFADHGMIPVRNSVDIIARLTKLKDISNEYLAFLDSTMARFWASDRVLNKIREDLKNLGAGRFLDKEDQRKYRIPNDRYGKLIYLAAPGTVISPSYYNASSPPKAMHGYEPSAPGQDTILILSSKSTANRREPVNLVDVAPTILDLCELNRPNHLEGRSLAR